MIGIVVQNDLILLNPAMGRERTERHTEDEVGGATMTPEDAEQCDGLQQASIMHRANTIRDTKSCQHRQDRGGCIVWPVTVEKFWSFPTGRRWHGVDEA